MGKLAEGNPAGGGGWVRVKRGWGESNKQVSKQGQLVNERNFPNEQQTWLPLTKYVSFINTKKFQKVDFIFVEKL